MNDVQSDATFLSSDSLREVFLLLPLMTIGHKAGHYCHFRVLRSVNSDTGRKKREGEEEKKVWNLLF